MRGIIVVCACAAWLLACVESGGGGGGGGGGGAAGASNAGSAGNAGNAGTAGQSGAGGTGEAGSAGTTGEAGAAGTTGQAGNAGMSAGQSGAAAAGTGGMSGGVAADLQVCYDLCDAQEAAEVAGMCPSIGLDACRLLCDSARAGACWAALNALNACQLTGDFDCGFFSAESSADCTAEENAYFACL